MSANPPTLTSPLSNQDCDASLAAAGKSVMDASTLYTQMSEYYQNMLTDDNLAGGMLISLGGAGTVPMTQAQLDQYRLFFNQLADIARLLTTGSPPPTGIVQPWLITFRTTGNVR